MQIGHISFRLAGSDGVSLEAAKLTQILARMGHSNYYFAGELDPLSTSNSLIEANIVDAMLVPEAHFTHPEALWLTEHAFGTTERHPEFNARLDDLTKKIEKALLEFIGKSKIDVIVAQNILAIPMNLALSKAVYQVIQSTGIPVIAHHHDFYWERNTYKLNNVKDILDQVFPPVLSNVRHMVINTMAQKSLAAREIESIVMPNILDFDSEPPEIDVYNRGLRQEIGLAQDDIFFLQPTRVVARKGIELSIELIRKLEDPRIKLVITHHAEYNSIDYLEEICAIAAQAHVPLLYLPARFQPVRQEGTGINKVFSLWDAYIHADFVTYPSLYEGFGNALIETIYFRKPVLVNRYQVYKDDIEPTGINAVTIDEEITPQAVDQVIELLTNQTKRKQFVDQNVKIAQKYFSYSVARTKLEKLLNSI